MKLFLILLFSAVNNWVILNDSEYEISNINVMFSHFTSNLPNEYGKIEYERICGGTAAITLDSFQITRNKLNNKIKVYLEVIEKDIGDPYPHCNLVVGIKKNSKYVPLTKVLQGNKNSNVIEGELEFHMGQKIFIWGLGTAVIQVDLK